MTLIKARGLMMADSRCGGQGSTASSRCQAAVSSSCSRRVGSSCSAFTSSSTLRFSLSKRNRRFNVRSRPQLQRIQALIHTEDNELIDFYGMLGLDKTQNDITEELIKQRYYSLAKECHPDVCDAENSSEMCILLNEAYETLRDPVKRKAYNYEVALQQEVLDEFQGFEEGYTYSEWWEPEDEDEDRAVFVDEVTCIGCRNCVWAAGATFRIEGPQHGGRKVNGKARAYAQWLNEEWEIQEAIDSCPTDCISWVPKDNLPYLEHCMAIIAEQGNLPTSDLILLSRAGSGFQLVAEDPYQYAERFAQKWAEFKRSSTQPVEVTLKVLSKVEQAKRLNAATGIVSRSKRWTFFNRGSSKNRHTIPFERSLVPSWCYNSYMSQYFAQNRASFATAAIADADLEAELAEPQDDVECNVESFRVTLVDESGEETVLCVPEDSYILDAAENAGIQLPFSCRAGTCPSCAATIELDDMENIDQSEQTFLDETMQSKGYVMTCRAYALQDCTISINKEKQLSMDLREHRRALRQARLGR